VVAAVKVIMNNEEFQQQVIVCA